MPKFPTFSSFLVACIIYALVIFCLVFKIILSQTEVKKYTDDKDAFMDVLIETNAPALKPELSQEVLQDEKPKEQIQQQNLQEPISVPEQLKEESNIPDTKTIKEQIKEVKEVTENIPEEKPNLKDLFSSIDTKLLKKDEKIQKPKKVEKPSNEANKIISNLKLDKTSNKSPNSQATGIYDPILGAIEKQIQKRWQSYKANSNNIAEIAVIVDSTGRFNYQILKLSYDEDFNNKVKSCLEVLKSEIFPHGNKTITINLNLVDKLQ